MSRNSSSGISSSSAPRKRGRPRHPAPTSANPNRNSRTASWGANSPSSSRSSSRKAPFSDFGSYMTEKNRKLREQFDADASSSGEGRGIFHGVSIFVDGHTVPSNQELKGYMLKHGGRFENYFSKQRVTHIICSNLPDSKLKNLRSFSRGLPVVKPTWVLDSLTANKLLSWVPYQLDDCVHETCKQQKLSAFFSSRKNTSFNATDSPIGIDENSESGFISQKTVNFVEDGQYSNLESEENEESCNAFLETSSEVRHSPLYCNEKEMQKFHGLRSSPDRHSEQIASNSARNQNCRVEEEIVTSDQCSKKLHCTLNDPDFVKNYFKNSRLHFIGTWRSRYRKRFLDKTNEIVIHNNINTPGLSTTDKSAIIHIDMDCFFVSVILRNHPELVNKPVAVCHSDNPKGTAEISSANYPARQYGIKAGMFVREAKSLCSGLVIFSYDFDAYEEVADQFYTILHKHCSRVQAVSCDEAFLDIRDVHEDGQKVAAMIRHEIAHTTGCTASAGIAENLLLARLATRSAKPNGQCYIPAEKVEDFLKDLPIQALPGIGYALEEKLKMHKIQTCGQLRLISKDVLQKDFGLKTGEMLWSYCRGIDNRMVGSLQETKSVGAEVNWGVRFKDLKDYESFLKNLCEEVSLRLQGCGMQGRSITLKVKKRREGAEEPIKYMGCGDCINMSRSLTVPFATDCAEFLERISRKIFTSFHVDIQEVRGIGLQISKLEHADVKRTGYAGRNILSWLSPTSKNSSDRPETDSISIDKGDREHKGIDTPNINHNVVKYNISEASPGSSSTLCHSKDAHCGSDISEVPPLSHLDLDVIKNLPSEIIAEYDYIYHGALSNALKSSAEKAVKETDISKPLALIESEGFPTSHGDKEIEPEGIVELEDCQPRSVRKHVVIQDKGKQPRLYHQARYESKDGVIQDKGKQPLLHSLPAIKIPTCNTPVNSFDEEPATVQTMKNRNSSKESRDIEVSEIMGGNSAFLGTSNHKGKWNERADLIPCSLSQVDASVLQQLPEDLKADILGVLPAHSKVECSDVSSAPANSILHDVRRRTYQYHVVNLWDGDPPRWVHEFHTSGCLILRTFSEAFFRNGRIHQLSSLLQSLISSLPPIYLSEGEWDEAYTGLSELLIQYIKFKIQTDIEEVYICLSLLQRFAQKSTFFLHIYEQLLPLVQESVGETYGGTLKF